MLNGVKSKLDKNLIEKKFFNSLNCYDKNATIQILMAKKLTCLIEENKKKRKKFSKILEIGSYSGILTKEIIKKFDFDDYLALDIVDSFEKIKNLNHKIRFKKIDVEDFKTNEKFDLIVANASLQWCNDFSFVIKKLKSYLKNDGIIAITTFLNDNFYEIRRVFDITLDYKKIEEIEELFSPQALIIQEIYTLQFNNSLELMKHLKLTGVNAISKEKINYTKMKKNLEALSKIYQNKLTYKPVYIVDFMNIG